MSSIDAPSRVVGLMAGTSLDGIDIALLATDGSRFERVCAATTHPYSDDTRHLLVEAVALGARIIEETALRQRLDQQVADEHADVVQELLAQHGNVDLIGFHGQTVWHAPELGRTLQLGDSQRLANRLGIPVVGQLRAADMAAGGEGAPLAPVYHAAALQQAGITEPAAWLNIGGVANLTLVDGTEIVGFDCGPGNALMDRAVQQHSEEHWDAGGARALAGIAHADVIQQAMTDDYFLRKPPKSLDRDHFLDRQWIARLEPLSLNDALATLAAITVAGVTNGLALATRAVQTLVVSGGGVHNQAIMDGLRDAGPWRVLNSDAIGAPADGVEAELVAFLAARQQAGLATSFPSTTGVAAPVVGGICFRPEHTS